MISADNIFDYSLDQLFNVIKKDALKIYKKYIFIGLSQEDYFELVKDEIEKTRDLYSEDIKYNTFMSNRIKIRLSSIVTELFNNKEKALEIINNYINYNFNYDCTYENATKSLKKLNTFLIKYNYFPNPNFIIELLDKNSVLKNTIKVIYEKKSVDIKKGKLKLLFDNDITINFIEIYCMLNNIEIDYSEDEEKISDFVVNDTLKAYLNEIGKYDVLTSEEEQKLFRKLRKGDKIARELFIASNLKLVVSIAKQYRNKGVSFTDLIGYGNIGLIEAVNKFDPDKGFKFSTYAIHWIRNEIFTGINDGSRNIKLPYTAFKRLKDYFDTVKKLEEELKRSPKNDEIAQEMGIDIFKVHELQKIACGTISLNELINEDNDELGDIIPSDIENPEEMLLHHDLPEKVMQLFINCNLNENEQKVLIYRFGFGNREPMTLLSISKKLGVTRERIRQIEAQALKKLRNSSYIKGFAIYMDYPTKALDNVGLYRERYETDFGGVKTFLKTSKSKEKAVPEIEQKEKKELQSQKSNFERNASSSAVIIEEKYDVVSDEDYNCLKNILINPKIQKLLNIFSYRELMIVLLNLGFVNKKEFSVEAISNLLKIDRQEVIDILKKVLLSYKYYLLNILKSFNNVERKL